MQWNGAQFGRFFSLGFLLLGTVAADETAVRIDIDAQGEIKEQESVLSEPESQPKTFVRKSRVDAAISSRVDPSGVIMRKIPQDAQVPHTVADRMHDAMSVVADAFKKMNPQRVLPVASPESIAHEDSDDKKQFYGDEDDAALLARDDDDDEKSGLTHIVRPREQQTPQDRLKAAGWTPKDLKDAVDMKWKPLADFLEQAGSKVADGEVVVEDDRGDGAEGKVDGEIDDGKDAQDDEDDRENDDEGEDGDNDDDDEAHDVEQSLSQEADGEVDGEDDHEDDDEGKVDGKDDDEVLDEDDDEGKDDNEVDGEVDGKVDGEAGGDVDGKDDGDGGGAEGNADDAAFA